MSPSFEGFSNSREVGDPAGAHCRIPILQMTKCRLLAMSAGSVVFRMPSGARGSVTHEVSSASVEVALGLRPQVDRFVVDSGDRVRPHVVVRCQSSDSRHLSSVSSTRPSLPVRCIRPGFGSQYYRPVCNRSMVASGAGALHQSLRALCSSSGPVTFSTFSGGWVGWGFLRQHLSPVLHL